MISIDQLSLMGLMFLDDMFKRIVLESNTYLSKLQQELGQELQIHYWKFEHPPSKIINELIKIEEASFPPELRYSFEEFSVLFTQKNPILMIMSVDKIFNSFLLIYEDPEDPKALYMDSAASLSKGRKMRFVKLMTAILYIWGYHQDYERLNLRTEDINHQGLPLREIWECQGFREYHRDDKGVYMGIEIYKELVDQVILWITGKIDNVHG
ncbi:MAG: hypothetical protein ACFFDT_30715 [Candidatus Hodarchaeota archaeon]